MALAVRKDDPSAPSLTIPLDKLGFLIVKARAFDGQDAVSDPNSGSNPTDDGAADVLEGQPDDPTRQELFGAIRALSEDQRIELIALAWVGRGTFDLADWQEALDTAYAEHGARPAHYLMKMPLLGDYLEEGLAAFGESIVDSDEALERPTGEDNA